MPAAPPSLSFTVKYPGTTNVLVTLVRISDVLAFNPGSLTDDYVRGCSREYKAIWDTGATNSVISQRVIDDCNLKPIGMTKVRGVGGEHEAENFFVSIFLPNKLIMPAIRVTRGELIDFDVLIGMDIINKGDFAVTHVDGKTTFSFRVPSREHIDFVNQKPELHHSSKVPRNAPCPCGSGKKYKKCCGVSA